MTPERAKRMTKSAESRIRVEERKAMRVKQKQSDFMRRTLSFHSAERLRAIRDGRPQPYYTLEQLRDWWNHWTACFYCGCKLTIKNAVPDHAVPLARGGNNDLANLRLCCKPCNWQKGQLGESEFKRLLNLLGMFEAEAATDIKRRLSIGGKFSHR
jgi:5-methylcytosine-specific restriction endonuclease McrA